MTTKLTEDLISCDDRLLVINNVLSQQKPQSNENNNEFINVVNAENSEDLKEVKCNLATQKIKVAFCEHARTNKIHYEDLTLEELYKKLTASKQSIAPCDKDKKNSKGFIIGEYFYENSETAYLRKHGTIDEKNKDKGKIYRKYTNALVLDIDGFNGSLDDFKIIITTELGHYTHCYYSTYSAFIEGGVKSLRFRIVIFLDKKLEQRDYENLCFNYSTYLKNKYPQLDIDPSSKTYNKMWFFGSYGGGNFIYGGNIKGELFSISQWLSNTEETSIKNGGSIIHTDLTKNIDEAKKETQQKSKKKSIEARTKILQNFLSAIEQLNNLPRDKWTKIIWGCAELMGKSPLGYEPIIEWCDKDNRILEKWGKEVNDKEVWNLYSNYNGDGENKITFRSAIYIAKTELKELGYALRENISNGNFYTEIIDISVNINLAKKHNENIPREYLKGGGDKGLYYTLTSHNFIMLMKFYQISIKEDQNTREIECSSKINDESVKSQNLKEKSNLDGLLSYISVQCRDNRIPTNEKEIKNHLNITAETIKYNYLKELIDSKKWDKKNRVDELIDCLILKKCLNNKQKNKIKRLIRIWFASVVAKQFEERPNNSGMLILHGKQGIGKTTFVASLFPNKKYISTGQNVDPTTKDGLMTIFRKIIFELGEVDRITMTKEASPLKNIITAETSEIRLPYERMTKDFINRTSFIGTTNEDTILKDQTGNRRYWITPLENIDLEKLENIDIQQVWTELFFYYEHFKNCKNKEEQINSLGRGWTTGEEEEFATKFAKNNMLKSDFIEELNNHFEPYNQTNWDKATALTIREIVNELGLKDDIKTTNNYEKAKLGAEMRAEGYRTFSHNGTLHYYMLVKKNGNSTTSRVPSEKLRKELEIAKQHFEKYGNLTNNDENDENENYLAEERKAIENEIISLKKRMTIENKIKVNEEGRK